jgi:hypothetical protein
MVNLDITRSPSQEASGISTATLPSQISTSINSIITESIVSAAAPTSYTTLRVTQLSIVTEPGGALSTSTFIAASVVTDPAQLSSLSAAAASSLSKTHTSSSHASSTATSASASAKSSPNLSTIIPAVVVPVAIILVATFAGFWFFMRRRHRRDLKNQPAFIMAAKTEKLTSTTNSLSSDRQDREPPPASHPAAPVTSQLNEKPLPTTRTRDVSPQSPKSSSGPPPNFSRGNLGSARTSNVREEQRPSPLLPPVRTDLSPNTRHIANFATNTSPTSNYSPKPNRNANPHLGPQTPHNSLQPGSKNISGRGPPAGVGTSNHVLTRNRSQSLTSRGAGSNQSSPFLNNGNWSGQSQGQRPPTAPTPGSRGPPPPRDFLPVGQPQPRSFSPIGNRAAPPAPIRTTPSIGSGAFINQPQYSPIVRDAPKAKRPNVTVPQTSGRGISYGSHNSPLLPSPQSDARRDHNLTAENLRIARLANSSRLGFDSPTRDEDNISEISAPDEAEEDAKSDVSSLNELEKFDFERDTRDSRTGSALGSIPGGRSGSAMTNNSPILPSGHESPWR